MATGIVLLLVPAVALAALAWAVRVKVAEQLPYLRTYSPTDWAWVGFVGLMSGVAVAMMLGLMIAGFGML